MPTLLIEHPITDFSTWLAAFGRFSDARRVVVELYFDTVVEAKASRSPWKPWCGRIPTTRRRSLVRPVRWSSSAQRFRR